jgi:hypothetical protein
MLTSVGLYNNEGSGSISSKEFLVCSDHQISYLKATYGLNPPPLTARL